MGDCMYGVDCARMDSIKDFPMQLCQLNFVHMVVESIIAKGEI